MGPMRMLFGIYLNAYGCKTNEIRKSTATITHKEKMQKVESNKKKRKQKKKPSSVLMFTSVQTQRIYRVICVYFLCTNTGSNVCAFELMCRKLQE